MTWTRDRRLKITKHSSRSLVKLKMREAVTSWEEKPECVSFLLIRYWYFRKRLPQCSIAGKGSSGIRSEPVSRWIATLRAGGTISQNEVGWFLLVLYSNQSSFVG